MKGQGCRRITAYDVVSLLSSLVLLILAWIALEAFTPIFFHSPFVKLLGYSAIFFLIVRLSDDATRKPPCSLILFLEIVAVGVFFLVTQRFSLAYCPQPIFGPTVLDIAISVEYAIKNLFTFHENPYNPSSIDRWAMPAQGVSVPYGPMMIFGYLPSLYGSFWFKICSLVYLAGILILSVRFAAQHSSTRLEKIAAGLFVTTFILMPRAIWNDIGAGVNDHFPVFLLLASLTLFQKKNEGLAGFLAGLSLAAKFSPAAFFILLFIRRTISVRFFAGVLLGALTMLPFFLWDQPRFLNDVFTFHFTKLGTKSGIRELLPRELHPIIWGFRIVCVLAFVVRNFWKDIEVKSLMREFTLLVILMNALYLEMHSNHIVWMLPTAAVLLTWYRFGALTNAKRILGGDQTVTQAESRG